MSDSKRPTVCMSLDGTRGTKTGRWGVMMPLFQEKMAPCRGGCPGAINIPKFIQLVHEDNIEGAWRTILENNPLPRITGRVCYHPCENRCTRSDYDDDIAIHALERYVGDWAHEKGLNPLDGSDSNGKRIKEGS